MNRPRYKLDRRRYRAGMPAGFLGYLRGAGFWSRDRDLEAKRNARRRWLIAIVSILALLAVVWIVRESFEALAIFQS